MTYVCPNCGNDRFHEVGAVATTTDVILEPPAEEGGKPTFVDYDTVGSQSIWDASVGYFIECSSCLQAIDAEDFISRQPDDEALAEIHQLLDGKMWDADTIEAVAAVIRATGKDIRPPEVA